MIDILTSQASFLTIFALFAAGGLGALLAFRRYAVANVWSNCLALAGSLWGLVFAATALISGHTIVISVSSNIPFLSAAFRVDKLSAFFMLTICLVAAFCSLYGLNYVKHFYKRYNVGVLGLLYNLFIATMLLVVSTSSTLFFLTAWELMALASYGLVIYDRDDRSNIKAGFLYIVMANLGTACLLLAFLLLYGHADSLSFEAIRAAASTMPDALKTAIFGLTLVGLGTKAGLIPMHIWLPAAHPAAPGHISALMSGVMIKTGVYMMIRLFLDMLQPIPAWWGVVVLLLGAVSCLLGVLYALAEHDIKRLLAYHSIENIGIILIGVGGAMVFSSLHQPTLVILSLAAALFHTINHAVFKSLLFLGATSVVSATGTRNIEKYGGLIRVLPMTALFFLVGSMAIAALPPFNGFFSEWLTFQALFQGALSTDFYIRWSMLLAAGALALSGGLALACFVKVFGATFLARPRSDLPRTRQESSLPALASMAGLAVLCLAFGLASGPIVSGLQKVGSQLTGLAGGAGLSAGDFGLAVSQQHAHTSGPLIFLLLLAVIPATWLVVRYVVNRRQRVSISRTWDCGVDLDERMEITSTGFARSITMIFDGVLKPVMEHKLEYGPGASPYLPHTRTVHLHIKDIYTKYFYRPLYAGMHVLSHHFRSIQSGNINLYLLYLAGALIIALVAGT